MKTVALPSPASLMLRVIFLSPEENVSFIRVRLAMDVLHYLNQHRQWFIHSQVIAAMGTQD